MGTEKDYFKDLNKAIVSLEEMKFNVLINLQEIERIVTMLESAGLPKTTTALRESVNNIYEEMDKI